MTLARTMFVFSSFMLAVDAHAHGGHIHGSKPESGTVVAYLIERLEANPDDLAALSKLAAIHLETARHSGQHADYVRAEETFRKLRALNRESGSLGLAYALIGQHRFSEALVEARRVVLTTPGSIDAWALLGDAHYSLGNYIEAEMAYERMAADGLTLESLSRSSQIHEIRGRYDEAVRLMSDACEAGVLLDSPVESVAWCKVMLGDLALKQGRLDTAQGHYEAALKLNGSVHVARWGLARVARQRRQLDEAERVLRSLVGQVSDPKYHILLGEVLIERSKSDEAQQWLNKGEAALLTDWKNGHVGHIRELAAFWMRHDRSVEAALGLALHDLKKVRRDVGAYETVAWALHKLGRTDEAVRYIEEALVVGISSGRLAWRAAMILESAGRPLRAQIYARLSLELNESMTLQNRQAAEELISLSQ